MNQLNSVLMEGNLTRDPELKYTSAGTAICALSVACNRYWKKGEDIQKEVSFFDVTAFGRLAEICAEYLKKGRGVRVVGRLKQERWVKDEQARSKVLIVAEHVEFKPSLKPVDGEVPEEQPPEAAQEGTVEGEF